MNQIYERDQQQKTVCYQKVMDRLDRRNCRKRWFSWQLSHRLQIFWQQNCSKTRIWYNFGPIYDINALTLESPDPFPLLGCYDGIMRRFL